MQNSIKAVKEKLAQNTYEMKSYYEKAEKEGRTLLDDLEQKAFDKIVDENVKLEQKLQELEQIEKAESKYTNSIGENAERLEMGDEEYQEKYSKVFNKYLRKHELSAEEKNILTKGFIQTRGTNIQTASGTATLGGNLVPEEWTRRIEIARAHIGSIKNIATVINTAGGGALPIPHVDDSTNTGEGIMTEGSAPAVNDFTFNSTTLNDYTYTSGIIKASWQLLNDEDVDLIPIIGEAAGLRIERAQSAHFATGDGSSKPNGAVTAASPYNAGGDGGSLTSSVIYDLVASVDIAYQNRGTFVFSPATLATIKKLSVGSSDNRPLKNTSGFTKKFVSKTTLIAGISTCGQSAAKFRIGKGSTTIAKASTHKCAEMGGILLGW